MQCICMLGKLGLNPCDPCGVSGKDDCSRIEADGVPLADLLLEASDILTLLLYCKSDEVKLSHMYLFFLCWKAAENLPANVSDTPGQVLEAHELLPC